MLVLARNLQTIISTNEGRCREGKSSVSDRFNALKMLQDVSLACNRGGYGTDCDREKQEVVQSVARSQPAPTRSQPTQSTASSSQGSRSNSGQNSGNSDNGIETAGLLCAIHVHTILKLAGATSMVTANMEIGGHLTSAQYERAVREMQVHIPVKAVF
jgi:hypothetical protein